MTSVAAAVRERDPPVPVTVKGYDPAVVAELTVIVNADEVPLAGFGLKLPTAPAGRPLTDRVTAERKPPLRVIAML